ncbi:hypothetical protein AAC387_Pa07g0291 [Persea americana]
MGQAASSSSSFSTPPTHHPNIQCQFPRLHRKEEDGDGDGDGEAGEDLTLLLPEECLACVMEKLGSLDRNTCSLVCKRWNLIDSRSRQRLVLAANSEVTPSLPAILSRFDAVSVLSLKCSRRHTSIDDSAFYLIARSLVSLKKLKLKGCVGIRDDGVDAASHLLRRSLRKLSCNSCSFTCIGLSSLLSRCRLLEDLTLKRLKNLKHQLLLDADDGDGGGGGGGDAPLARLQRLCLKDLHNANLLAPLISSSKSLRTLVICRSAGLWDPVFLGLCSGSLAEIQLENLQLSDAGLLAISSACLDLEVLYISRASHCTDAGFAAIAASCRKLRKLHIDTCAKFGGYYGGVGDDGVVSIAARCSQLQEVVLMGVALTVISLHALASNCPSLERMALCNIDSVGDPELGFVAAKFSALRKLCIKNCPVSDAGIEAIAAGCPNLVKLKVKRCKEVTQANVCRLRQQRVELVIALDVESLSIAEEQEMAAEELESANVHGRGRGPRTVRPLITSSSTHLVCGSRGANLIKSKLTNAMLLRRPGMPSASSSHSSRR